MGIISVANFNNFNEGNEINRRTYTHYFMRLKMLACAMFKWEGFPDTIPKRFIENNLFQYGELAVFEDETNGLMVTKCTPSGMLNVYDEPVAYHCYGNNGFKKTVKTKDIVIIRNNIDSIPTAILIDLFCNRLYELKRTADTNIKQMKTPLIIQCEDSQRLTLKNLLRKYDGNEPFIFGNKALDLEGVKVLKTDVPFIADKLNLLKNDELKECLDMLGINNANTDKKERLNVEEVNSNNEYLNFESESMKMCREYACIEIKQKFHIDVTCELRKVVTEILEEPKEDKGGEE